MSLLDAFLNPLAFDDGGTVDPGVAAGRIVRGMTRQTGNEIDEFVTEALRNKLLGLPLDLPAINIARARETGVPRLNAVRAAFYAESGNSALGAVHELDGLRLQPQAPRVAGELRGGLRQAPEHHRRSDRPAHCRRAADQPGPGGPADPRERGRLHEQHRQAGPTTRPG